jgi:hypothetical protein
MRKRRSSSKASTPIVVTFLVKSALRVAGISMLVACSRPDVARSQSNDAASTSAADASTNDIKPGDIIDVMDDTGAKGSVRIEGMLPDPHDATMLLYQASIRGAGSETWEPYCKKDRDGRNAAFAIAGGWSVDGPNGTDGVTLACTSGAIGKCMRLGYRPWDTLPSRASMSDLLTACTRMIRADYCGNGQSHTKDGTWVDIYDRFGIQKREPRAGVPERFEAAWGPNGATYLSVGRWTDDVQSIARECPDKLAGRVGAPIAQDEITRKFPETMLFDDHPAREEDRLMH